MDRPDRGRRPSALIAELAAGREVEQRRRQVQVEGEEEGAGDGDEHQPVHQLPHHAHMSRSFRWDPD